MGDSSVSYSAGIIGAGGVAGTGFIGTRGLSDIEQVRSTHAGGYDAASGIDLVAVCDTDEAQLREFGELWDVPAERRYRDHQTMLAEEDLDVVSICTPTFLHHQHTIDAVNAPNPPGVIWCEKPIACSVADAEAMVEVCETAGVDLVINHSQRFYRQHQRLQEAVADGLIGDVHGVACNVHWDHNWIGDVEELDAVEHIILYDFGIHWFDMLTCLVDKQPQQVFANYERSPSQEATPPLTGAAVVEFDEAQATLTFDGATPPLRVVHDGLDGDVTVARTA